MLILDGLTKRYANNAAPAVDSLALTVNPGEIFGFIGPNGAGKTTTIKMITGILTPDSGDVNVFGRSMAREPLETKKLIGYVSDNHEVYERLTGLEYLNFLADVYDVSAQERKTRMEYYLDMFELSGNVAGSIKSYSHGMKQKLCLIGALLHNPPLWVLDEPLTGLDPQSAHNLKRAMRAHCDDGNIVFFSTHVLDVAERLCDKVGIISRGKLIELGTLDGLRERYGADDSLESLFLSIVGREE